MLYIVATPIGNLKDITLRALDVLKSVDFILCEDTRVTKKLLNYYQIKTPTISYHHHTPEKKVKEIIQLLSQGKNLALVTDAGTPGISDPGNKLISSFFQNSKIQSSGFSARGASLPDGQGSAFGGRVQPIPGPCALTAALSISGLPADKFVFLGFPPHKKGRQKFWQRVIEAEETVIFYESPHRILKSLSELTQNLNTYKLENFKTQLVVCRELTKQFETIYRGTLAEIIEKIKKDSHRGEFVIVLKKESR